MGIKCSLLGHAYGETTVERDREEQGSEVVITIREIETCKRCGQTRVVSENKEVTSIETPETVSAGEDTGETAPTERAQTAGSPDSQTAATSVGAEIVDAEAGEPVASEGGDDAGTDTASDAGDGPSDEEGPSAAEDDGVILEDDDSDPERDPGEWPEDEASDSAEDEQASSSETEHGPSAADGIERFTDDEESPAGSVAEGPIDDTATEQSADAEKAPLDRDDTSEVWSEADPDLDADRPDGTVTVPDGQYRCPACGFTTPVASSSLREGDFCPECHQDTLVHESD
ncbi:MAG: hypothetical protein ABEI98_05105 [Halorhabdus sp.]